MRTEDFDNSAKQLTSADISFDPEFKPHDLPVWIRSTPYKSIADLNNIEYNPYVIDMKLMHFVSDNSILIPKTGMTPDAFYSHEIAKILFYGDLKLIDASECIYGEDLTYVGIIMLRFGRLPESVKFCNAIKLPIKNCEYNMYENDVEY